MEDLEARGHQSHRGDIGSGNVLQNCVDNFEWNVIKHCCGGLCGVGSATLPAVRHEMNSIESEE